MDSPQLTQEHRNYLNQAAISNEIINQTGIYSTDTGLAFPYRYEGTEVIQHRPDNPGDGSKYIWAPGVPLILNQIRNAGQDTVLVVEGTKQALAVASWAPLSVDVWGMPGCWGWSKVDLTPFEDKKVVIILDGDASTNPKVYEAGEKFAEALDLLDAEASFIYLPVEGKDGADDYLSTLAEDMRTKVLGKLISRAKPKPAKCKPPRRVQGTKQETVAPDTGGREGVAINLDRLQVITKITDALLERLDGRELFCFGGALTRVKETSKSKVDARTKKTSPLNFDDFLLLLVNNVACYDYKAPTEKTPAVFKDAWPDDKTVRAVLSGDNAEKFTQLDRVVTTPFIRGDGTVCAKEGFDKDTNTYVALGPGMDRISVPEDPTKEETQAAARFLVEEWFGDMPFKIQSDRANALALVLTPLIRSLVPLVPQAVVNGLQPSSGKNLLTDCLSIYAVGGTALYGGLPKTEEEMRKQITSEFREGKSFLIFDEAHVIDSEQLARALTSHVWRDRLLGVSQMVEFPNHVTWMSMGNNVQVNGDMDRRVYYIALHPTDPNPQDRSEDQFRHPDLKEWTRENRQELVSAGLTVCRGWFAAGCPRGTRTQRMGSFEIWDKMMSGILEYAGVEGFLEDLVARRSENNFTASAWLDHLTWLWTTFETQPFVARDVQQKAVADLYYEAPPTENTNVRKDAIPLHNASVDGWTRELGKRYAKIKDRWWTVDGQIMRLVVHPEKGHGNTNKWVFEVRGSGAQPAETPSGGNVGGSGGTPTPSLHEEKQHSYVLCGSDYACTDDVCVSHVGGGREASPPSPPIPPDGPSNADNHGKPEVNGHAEGVVVGGNPPSIPPQRTGSIPEAGGTHPPIPPTVQERGEPIPPSPQERTDAVPQESRNEEGTTMDDEPDWTGATLGFDLECHDADTVFTHERGDYVRLVGAGTADRVSVTTDTDVLSRLSDAGAIVGHNLALYDLPVIGRHHGVKVEDTIPRAHDLRFVAFQADPPHSGQSKPGPNFKRYSLDALAERYLDGHKSPDGKLLASEFSPVNEKVENGHVLKFVNGPRAGETVEISEPLTLKERQKYGWGNIPQDDPRYIEYCRDDVKLSLELAAKLPLTDYDRREMEVAAVTARATLEGWRVDVPALTQRVKDLEEQSQQVRTMLSEQFGFPLDSKAPQRTTAGKKAFQDALISLGFTAQGLADQGLPFPFEDRWPRAKDGSLLMGKEVMKKVVEFAAEHNHPALPVLRAVQEMNGIRNNAANVLKFVVGDRVHPKFEPFQNTGRWSVIDPGLTVLKKKVADSERAFLLPDEGHVLLSVDLDQADIRGVAAHAQDPNLIEILNDPSRDFYSEIAEMTFGNRDPKNRKASKPVALGWMYGLTINGLVRQGVDRAVGEAVFRVMAEKFPFVTQWQRRVRGMAEAGCLLNSGFGRNLRCEPGREFTQAPAVTGQSCTRDLIAEGLLTLARTAPELVPGLRGIVHDETVFSIPERDKEECARIIQGAFSREWAPAGASIPVKFTAGQGKPFAFGHTWAQCYEGE